MARSADPALAERRRREILEAAIACFRRSGFHQASMHTICAEANLSPGAVYRYFPSKADIIAAIAEEDRRAIAAIIDGALTSGDVAEDLQRSAQLVIDRYSDAASSGLLADVVAEAARDPSLAERLAAIDTEMQVFLVEAITRGQARGAVDPAIDPATAATVLPAALDGLVLRMAVLRRGDPAQALAHFRALVERYLAPRQQPTSKPQRHPA